MRCLILGGTGFLGVNLTNLLINLGNEVTVFSSGANKDLVQVAFFVALGLGMCRDFNGPESSSQKKRGLDTGFACWCA